MQVLRNFTQFCASVAARWHRRLIGFAVGARRVHLRDQYPLIDAEVSRLGVSTWLIGDAMRAVCDANGIEWVGDHEEMGAGLERIEGELRGK